MSTVIDIEKVVAAVNAMEARAVEWQDKQQDSREELVISAMKGFGMEVAVRDIKDAISAACRDAGVKGPWESGETQKTPLPRDSGA